MVVGGQTAAFFDIEKNDGAGSEAFGFRGSRGILRVLGSVSFCSGFILEFASLAAAVQDQKAETLGAKKLSLAAPRICFLPRRGTDPIPPSNNPFPSNPP